MPGDFLHYGYFKDKGINPRDISLADLYTAQLNYAELIISKIINNSSKVLDVGCGTGGLINLLQKNKYKVVGLTPDRLQIQYIS